MKRLDKSAKNARQEQVPYFHFFLRCLKRFYDTGITLTSTQYKDG